MNSNENICPICLENLSSNTNQSSSTNLIPAKSNICNHITCLPCLLEWTKSRNCCAVCAQPFLNILVLDHKNPEVVVDTIHLYPEDCQEWIPVRMFRGPQDACMITFADLDEHEYFEMSLRFRKLVYRQNIHGQVINNTENNTFHIDTNIFSERPALMHRFIPFITRELCAVLETDFNPQIQDLTLQILQALKDRTFGNNRWRHEIINSAHMQSKSDHFFSELTLFFESMMYMKEFDSNVIYEGLPFTVQFICTHAPVLQ